MFDFLPPFLKRLYQSFWVPYARGTRVRAAPEPDPEPDIAVSMRERMFRVEIIQDAFCERRPKPQRLFRSPPGHRNMESWCDLEVSRYPGTRHRCAHCTETSAPLQTRQRRRLEGRGPPAPPRHPRVDASARAAPRLGRNPPPPARRAHSQAGTAAGDLDHSRLEALARPKARIPSGDRPLVHRRTPRGRGQARARPHAHAATHVPAQPRPPARRGGRARTRAPRATPSAAPIPVMAGLPPPCAGHPRLQ